MNNEETYQYEGQDYTQEEILKAVASLEEDKASARRLLLRDTGSVSFYVSKLKAIDIKINELNELLAKGKLPG